MISKYHPNDLRAVSQKALSYSSLNLINYKKIDILMVDDSPYNLFILKEMMSNFENIKVLDTAMNG